MVVMESDLSIRSNGNESTAAVKLQKVYRSYRTRRRLADSAVVAEELWWQAIDYARLNYSTVSFFYHQKSETAASRWSRISLIASKIGKGLCEDSNAKKLAFQHWIEAIDPRHRYGHNLNFYYEEWCHRDSVQPFFYWLDVGDGKEVEVKECPRSRLREECIRYFGPKKQEREFYEYTIREGLIWHKVTGKLLDTKRVLPTEKWIFVLSACKKLYVGEKQKGTFHHSSFLAGGATLAAGRLVAQCGKLESVSAYSGHYRPTDENLSTFIAFLKDNGVSLEKVQVTPTTDDCENFKTNRAGQQETTLLESIKAFATRKQDRIPESWESMLPNRTKSYIRSLSANLRSPRAISPESEIVKRIESKREAGSYQLGKQLSLRWSTGAGPRIGCIADYPKKLRTQALDSVDLSTTLPIASSESARSLNPESFCKMM